MSRIKLKTDFNPFLVDNVENKSFHNGSYEECTALMFYNAEFKNNSSCHFLLKYYLQEDKMRGNYDVLKTLISILATRINITNQ